MAELAPGATPVPSGSTRPTDSLPALIAQTDTRRQTTARLFARYASRASTCPTEMTARTLPTLLPAWTALLAPSVRGELRSAPLAKQASTVVALAPCRARPASERTRTTTLSTRGATSVLLPASACRALSSTELAPVSARRARSCLVKESPPSARSARKDSTRSCSGTLIAPAA